LQRRYASEFIGTLFLTFTPVAVAGSAHTQTGGDASLATAAWAAGLAVVAMVYALGPVSAHFNPAVTLGFALARRFPARYAIAYITMQLLGAVAGAGLGVFFFGAGYGTTTPALGETLRALAMEGVLTFFLMLVVLAVACDTRISGAVPALAIGLLVVVNIFIGGPLSGAAMNPARALGPALWAGGGALQTYWLYVIGPCMGAALAALVYNAVLRPADEWACHAPADLPAPSPRITAPPPRPRR